MKFAKIVKTAEILYIALFFKLIMEAIRKLQEK
jgi:hypothetical protein